MPSTINADNGVVSGSSGVKTTADTSGVLALQSNGSTGLTLDTALNVGIGTASPATKLDVNGGVTSTAVTIKTTANTGLIFNDTVADRWQFLNRNDAGDVFQIVSGNINSGGSSIANLTSEGFAFGNIGLGFTTPTTSGTGITFPATQSVSSDANTLDDYEEGTWTPTVTAQTGSYTTYVSSGTYTKVGRVVSLSGYFRVTSMGTGSGIPALTNFPFAALSISGLYAISALNDNTGSVISGGLYVAPPTKANVYTATGGDPVTANQGISFSLVYFV